jgi:hypothetical protein
VTVEEKYNSISVFYRYKLHLHHNYDNEHNYDSGHSHDNRNIL